jgi:hypothetical protein
MAIENLTKLMSLALFFKKLYITFWLAYICTLKVLSLFALRCPRCNDCCVNGLCACDLRKVRRTSVSLAGKRIGGIEDEDEKRG